MPVAEALASAISVLTSYNSPMLEFAGFYALYANPLSIDEIAECIEALTESRDDSATLDRRFDWDNHIEKMIDVYHRI